MQSARVQYRHGHAQDLLLKISACDAKHGSICCSLETAENESTPLIERMRIGGGEKNLGEMGFKGSSVDINFVAV